MCHACEFKTWKKTGKSGPEAAGFGPLLVKCKKRGCISINKLFIIIFAVLFINSSLREQSS